LQLYPFVFDLIFLDSCTQQFTVYFYSNLQAVIVQECKHLKPLLKREGVATSRTNHILVLNLAFSDFLMGVYLLILGIAGAVHSGVYCSKSLQWLTSPTCVMMGVLVVLSSETSVFTLVLLSATRLYGVFNVSN